MLETIGRIMIARTMIAVKTLAPAADGVPKSGIHPSPECSHGSMCVRSAGPSTRMPHSPTRTLGTAASVSTSAVTGAWTTRGASSERKSATPIASGVATRSAKNDVMTVPKRKLPAP